jgi:hypothetical protein
LKLDIAIAGTSIFKKFLDLLHLYIPFKEHLLNLLSPIALSNGAYVVSLVWIHPHVVTSSLAFHPLFLAQKSYSFSLQMGRQHPSYFDMLLIIIKSFTILSFHTL